ncbi:23S rRNA pseudouridine(1911/1915/1917) synthase RluD [Buchnera aphidicola]|uniref:23S rRNA pseudouridine(1911/1915/1917) synthase RluD n=1 Tax=Buchnera aphidicola TaxID=9 RepID=UPI00346441B2
MKKKIILKVLENNIFNKRLDLFLSNILSKYSRSFFKKLILSGKVLVNCIITKIPKRRVCLGDEIIILINEKSIDSFSNIVLDIVYEDKYLLILNKPAGLVVHPGFGNTHGTLLNALLFRDSIFHNIPRAGILHRLDKNTTGLMIVAKNLLSYNRLVYLLKNRQIIREYEAVVLGNFLSGGTINFPIMRHFKKRVCMMTHLSGKPSITHYRIIKRFKYYTHLKIRLETGRTHQIRVHMLHIKHPIIGDRIYQMRNLIPKGIDLKQFKSVYNFPRQALHAIRIKFFHPINYTLIDCNISLPSDILNLINIC